jgi:hypothetical protein
MTPWHAIGIDAFLFEKATEYHRKITGIEMILSHDNKYMVMKIIFPVKPLLI